MQSPYAQCAALLDPIGTIPGTKAISDELQHLGSDRLNEIFRLAIGAPTMSAIRGYSENIYSLRVLPPMCRFLDAGKNEALDT
jgi:hypothetical protein